MPIRFELEHTHDSARAGRLFTDHGDVETPVFMPVGTQAAVKAVSPEMLRDAGARIVLANTYHLVLRPGAELVAEAGGLHRFMGWDGPILTDSGGFQVLSLSDLRKVSDEGITFRSHIDGALHLFTPESAIRDQALLGADLIMSFDYCTSAPCERNEAERAVELTTDWAQRGAQVFGTRFEQGGYERILFGIVQGSTYTDLRDRSLEELLAIDFPGYAIGGLSVGEDREQTRDVAAHVAEGLPADKPRYLMGMGTPIDLMEGVARGIDMFDCVMPTRNARNGTVFTRRGRMVLKNAKYTKDFGPIDESCGCYACRQFTRAYLRHLFQAGEMLGPTLATQHSLYFYAEVMRDMRRAILADGFADWRKTFTDTYNSGAGDDADPL
jgi:queuine tRNA-ribosyltransferase